MAVVSPAVDPGILNQACVQVWGGDGLVPAVCRGQAVFRRRAVPPRIAEFLQSTLPRTAKQPVASRVRLRFRTSREKQLSSI